ncbi:MAG: ribokinase [Capsulimonadaceae bacterium]
MHSSPNIVVLGSCNTDLVAYTASLPGPGETVIGSRFLTAGGGKGANQAVAAARLGGCVTLIARVGQDGYGDIALRQFELDGIDTSRIVRDPEASTGTAMICVATSTGENSIIVIPGANGRLSVSDVEDNADVIRSAAILLCQLESPIETVAAALEMAHGVGVTTILNPAPSRELPSGLLGNVSILTPNRGEATALTGESTVERAGAVLTAAGAESVVITLGVDGALLVTGGTTVQIPAVLVANVVDTTAAGDCFNGALAVAVVEGKSLAAAVEFARVAAAISVTRAGAQPSLPTRAEVDNYIAIANSAR